MATPYPVPYPRHTTRRRLLRLVSRGLLRLFSEPVITGLENLPERGPFVLVGNHVDMLEAAMMGIYVPFPIEVIGAGDIPLDPRFAWIINLYGYLPINRGNLDRKGLMAALGVLRQGGVLGLFPEGGIWQQGSQQARTGVAWLSQMAQAPLVPVGFGGMKGAVGKLLRFEHPRLTMTIGQPLPPVERGTNRKAALEEAANHIMASVYALVPERDRWMYEPGAAESFDLDAAIMRPDGSTQTLYDDFPPEERAVLGKLFYRPVLLETLRHNCKLPVSALQTYEAPQDAAALADAATSVLGYLETTNPQFFNYRLGYAEGGAVARGLHRLAELARRAAETGGQVVLAPRHTVETEQRRPRGPETT